MKLIIAEKPSQAQEYAKALGHFQRQDGYLQNKDYFITWCFGHLIELERDDAYREPGKWNKEYLPLIPKKYKYRIGHDKTGKPDAGKTRQLKIISKLINQSSGIINATDADREGELIFLYVYNYLNCKLPYKRLWISSLTVTDIRKGFSNLLSAEQVYHLGKSAYARAIADWLVGINGTQSSTLQFGNGTLLTIGRVQTAILKIICERYLNHLNHKKTFTYKLRALHKTNVDFYSESEIYSIRQDAEAAMKSLFAKHHCTGVESKEQNISPPLLYSIDSLIMDANKMYKYSGQKTLDTAQKLYEKRLTSYPRTDNEYINQENYSKLKSFLPAFANNILQINYSFIPTQPKSVNDSKLTSHDAIVPTGELPDLNKLSEEERNIFRMILMRCLQSFSSQAIYKKTKISFENNTHKFYTYTSKQLESGWKKYSIDKDQEQETNEDQELDIIIAQGDYIDIKDSSVREIESKPPQLYSEVNLTKELTNFGLLLKQEKPEVIQNIKAEIDINSLQIGTQATRPGIIERLKHLEFIELKNNRYIPTQKGLDYYHIIKDLTVSDVVTTAIWEMKLKKVAEGKEDIKLFYNGITAFTEKIVSDIFSRNPEHKINAEKKESICKCPKCKVGEIRQNKNSFNCSEWKKGCDFTVWNRISGKKISSKNVSDLIQKKQTTLIKGFKSKAGKSFDAHLQMDNEFKVKFKFNN